MFVKKTTLFNHKFVNPARMWGFYLEGVWLVMPSEEASRQKCDKLLYVSMGGACVLSPLPLRAPASQPSQHKEPHQ